MQDAQILLGRPLRPPLHQHVVGPAKAARREQISAIAIVRQRPGLTHQPVDHVTIFNAVLAASTQPRQRFHPPLGVPHLQVRYSVLQTLGDLKSDLSNRELLEVHRDEDFIAADGKGGMAFRGNPVYDDNDVYFNPHVSRVAATAAACMALPRRRSVGIHQ